jgi:TolA-binding protein
MKCKAIVVAGLLLAVSLAQAGEDGKGGGFWTGLQSKLQKLTPTRKSTAVTAVGGVRGAKSGEVADLYWKGEEKRVEVGEDELEKFNLAMETRVKGDSALARKHFEEFLRDFPQSSLRPEAQQAVEKLKAEGATPAGEQAPAAAGSK